MFLDYLDTYFLNKSNFLITQQLGHPCLHRNWIQPMTLSRAHLDEMERVSLLANKSSRYSPEWTFVGKNTHITRRMLIHPHLCIAKLKGPDKGKIFCQPSDRIRNAVSWATFLNDLSVIITHRAYRVSRRDVLKSKDRQAKDASLSSGSDL